MSQNYPTMIKLRTRMMRTIFLSVQQNISNANTYDVLLDFDTYETATGLHDIRYEEAMRCLLTNYSATYNGPTSVSLRQVTADVSYDFRSFRDATPSIFYKIKSVLNAEMCGCGRELITDGENVCYKCGMALEALDMSQTFCPICQDLKIEKVVTLSCCSQQIHRACLRRHNQYDRRCPMCRAQNCKEI